MLHVKPPFLQEPNVFVGFIKNTTIVGQVTFGKNWTTKTDMDFAFALDAEKGL